MAVLGATLGAAGVLAGSRFVLVAVVLVSVHLLPVSLAMGALAALVGRKSRLLFRCPPAVQLWSWALLFAVAGTTAVPRSPHEAERRCAVAGSPLVLEQCPLAVVMVAVWIPAVVRGKGVKWCLAPTHGAGSLCVGVGTPAFLLVVVRTVLASRALSRLLRL